MNPALRSRRQQRLSSRAVFSSGRYSRRKARQWDFATIALSSAAVTADKTWGTHCPRQTGSRAEIQIYALQGMPHTALVMNRNGIPRSRALSSSHTGQNGLHVRNLRSCRPTASGTAAAPGPNSHALREPSLSQSTQSRKERRKLFLLSTNRLQSRNGRRAANAKSEMKMKKKNILTRREINEGHNCDKYISPLQSSAVLRECEKPADLTRSNESRPG